MNASTFLAIVSEVPGALKKVAGDLLDLLNKLKPKLKNQDLAKTLEADLGNKALHDGLSADNDLVKSWEVLNNPSSTADFSILRKNVDLLNSIKRLQTKFPDVDFNKIALNAKAGGAAIENLFVTLDKVRDVGGLNVVLSDLAQGGNKFIGANFMVSVCQKKGDDFMAAITRFEAYDADIVNGIRKYDIEKADGLRFTKIECKRWIEFYPGPFREQFLKDLGKMEYLGEVEWKFAKTTGIPDIATLKQNVLSSLGTYDDVAKKWVAGSEVTVTLDANKVKALFPEMSDLINTSNYADKLLEGLSTSKFENIFEIIQ